MQYDYDRTGLVREQRNGNGTATSTNYDAAGRPLRISLAKGTSVLNLTEYTYGHPNGLRTEERINRPGGAQVTTYRYDDANRLRGTTRVDGPDRVDTAWTLDLADNRLTETVTSTGANAGTVTRSYTYDARNQLRQIADSANGTTALTYDVQGNLTQKVRGNDTTNYVWSARDLLASVSRNGTLLGRYSSDALGMRVQKEAIDPLQPGAPPRLLNTQWDDENAVQDRDADGNVVARYDFAGGQPVAMWSAADGSQVLHADALGSVVATTAADGSVKSEILYDAWGNPTTREGASANKFLYTGHQGDAETGLYYFKARYYDPETGRFISVDPADGQDDHPSSYNKYLYAFGNPLFYVDPDGETNKEALGLDDRSLEESMKNDSVWWGGTKYAAKSTFYEAWNFATGGFVKRHDNRLELRDSGQITQEQYEKSLVLDATVSVAGSLAGGAVGGKVAGAVGGRVAANAVGRVTTEMATGAAVGATVNTIEQAGQLVEHHAISEKLGRAEFSVGEVVKTAALSAAIAPVASRAAAVIDGMIAKAIPKRASSVSATESAGGPGAAPSTATTPETKSVAAQPSMRERVLQNIERTRAGNESSRFNEHIDNAGLVRATVRNDSVGAMRVRPRQSEAGRSMDYDRHGDLKGRKDIAGQSHHLNQDAAYGSHIPHNDGIAVKLEGNAFRDVGTPHYDVHASLEKFWNQYRKGGSLQGQTPTNFDYLKGLRKSLSDVGYTAAEAKELVRAAARNQIDHGLFGGQSVPNMPGRINQKK